MSAPDPLSAALRAIRAARDAVLAAVDHHGRIYCLDDADLMLQDAAAQVEAELDRMLPEHPIHQKEAV